MAKMWQGIPPKKCDLCLDALNDTFIDGKTKFGPWAIMCSTCYLRIGIGIGIGHGQRYQLQDNVWIKTAG